MGDRIIVHGGTLPKQAAVFDGKHTLRISHTMLGPRLDCDLRCQVAALEQITESNKVSFARAAGWGVVGSLLAGPLGALAGALLGSRRHRVLFAMRTKDGDQILAETSPEAWAKMQMAFGAFAPGEPSLGA